MEVRREPGGGISLSAKSRHLPLRKQSRHDSMGKSTSSLIEAALFLMRYFNSRDTILHFHVVTGFLAYC
jgi:hypothetical protein